MTRYDIDDRVRRSQRSLRAQRLDIARAAIRVLRTRDGLAVTEELVEERAQNLVQMLEGLE